MKELTGKMRNPRKGKPLGASDECWYYVGPTSIDVFIQHDNGTVTSGRLTRRQMIQALTIMADAEKPR